MEPSQRVSTLAKRLSLLTAAVLALLPFHAFLTTWVGSNFGHFDLIKIWKEILIVAMMPAIFWLVLQPGQLKTWFRKSWVVRLCAVYVLLNVALGLLALSRDRVSATALIYALIINLRFLGFFLLCLVLASYSDILKKYWKKILVWPATAVVTFGLVQKFILPTTFLSHFGYELNTIPAYQTVDANIDYRRIQSTLRGANPLGAYLVLIIPAIILTKTKQWKLALGLAASLIVLFFSYSRSAWIGLAVAILLLSGWTIKEKVRQYWLILVVIAVAVTVTMGVYTLRSNQIVQNTLFHTSSTSASAQSPNAVRMEALKSGAQDVISEPLGRGPGTAGPASFRNNHQPRIAENYFLQIAQEVGILGIAIFIAINILIARMLWRDKQETLPKILLASLVGITIINLVSHAWTDDTLSLLWWGLAGIALAPGILAQKGKRYARSR